MLRGAVLGALVTLALASTAPAHGGRYRGPASEVDPSLRGMEDPPPPESPNDLTATPSSDQPPPRFAAPTFASWRFWWRYNEESLLAVPPTGTTLDPKLIEERIVPLLDRFARGTGVRDELQAAALLGLARLGRTERLPLLMEIALDKDHRHHVVARRAACLALGLLGRRTPEVLGLLRARGADSSGYNVHRCHALFALGLLGRASGGSDPESLVVLRAVVVAPDSPRDARSSALAAIGLLGDRAAVPDLLAWLRDGNEESGPLGEVPLASVAEALGRIGAPGLPGGAGREVVEALGAELSGGRPLPRRSAAIALGRIGAAADEATAARCAALLREAIAKRAWTPGDDQTAYFAIISLGRIAAGTGPPPAIRESARKTLLGILREGAEGARAFAALALGVAGRGLEGEAREGVAAALRAALARSRDSTESGGAAAVALGLLRDAAPVKSLREMLESTRGDPRLRADAALALGLIGDPSAGPALRVILEKRGMPELLHDAALALGLLRDRAAVDPLIDLLESMRTNSMNRAAAVRALGWIGDAGSATRLLALVEDEESEEYFREKGVVALVRVATGGRDDDLAALSEDMNYRAWYFALGEVLRLL